MDGGRWGLDDGRWTVDDDRRSSVVRRLSSKGCFCVWVIVDQFLAEPGFVRRQGVAHGLELAGQGLALLVDLVQGLCTGQVAPAVDQVLAGNGLEQGAQGEPQEAGLLGVGLASGALGDVEGNGGRCPPDLGFQVVLLVAW